MNYYSILFKIRKMKEDLERRIILKDDLEGRIILMTAHQLFDAGNDAKPGISSAFIQWIAVTLPEMSKEKFVAVCSKNTSHSPRRDPYHISSSFSRAYQYFLDSFKQMMKATPENADEAALRLLCAMFYLKLNGWR